MRFISSLDTRIYGIDYLQGALVDTTGWSRKQLLQFLGNGIISPADLNSEAVGDISIGEFADVDLTGADEGDILTWDDGKWRPLPPGGAISIDLDSLDDVDVADAENGMALVFDGSLWRAVALPTGDPAGTAAAAMAAHEAASDPHPQYTTSAEVSTAIGVHEAAPDPHPQYLTQTEGDGRYAQTSADLNDWDLSTAPTAGQVPKWDAVASRWKPAADDTGGGGGGASALDDLDDVDVTTTPPTDGQALVFDDASGLWVPGTVSGGGGGGGVLLLDNGGSVPGGTAVGTIIFEKAAGAVTWDFTAGALPAGWAKHGTPTETFSGAGMACSMGAGQGYFVTGYTGDGTLDLYVDAMSVFSSMFGANITNSSGDGATSGWYTSPSGVLAMTNTAYSYSSTFANGGGTPGVPSVLRLRKSGNLYYASASLDNGSTFTSEVSVSHAAVTTRLNFGPILSSLTATVRKVVWTPGASGSGKAKGWWDGSVIQPLA